MKAKINKTVKQVLKWTLIIFLSYFIATSLYYGEGSFDERTGVSSFYWSGLDDLGRADKASGLLVNEQYPTFLDGTDGPYVFGDKYYVVTDDNEIIEGNLDSSGLILVNTGIEEFPNFSVNLRSSYATETYNYQMPEKLIAISDMEGNLTGFYSFLLANNVIDKKGDWIFGRGALVLNGDFFDRGPQVTPLLWFIYHLDNQALQSGGKVHFILGNHEIKNLSGDASDGAFKYIEIAKRISGENQWDKAIRYLYSEKSEIGKWLRSKNICEKIGSHVFVHGGLNRLHLQERFSLEEINMIARKYMGKNTSALPDMNKREAIITNTINSPYWDRRLNLDWKIKWTYKLNRVKVQETTEKDLDQILDFYSAEKIIIGHSIVHDISTGYNDKVIKIDVEHGEGLSSGKTRGLLIYKNNYYKINDLQQMSSKTIGYENLWINHRSH